MSRSLVIAFLMVALFGAAAGPSALRAQARADATAPSLVAPLRYRDDAIVMRLAVGVSVDRRSAPIEALGIAPLDALARELGGVRFEPEFPEESGDLGAFWIAHLLPGADAAGAAARFASLEAVESAWPIAIMPAAATPNDSMWSEAYYFYQPSRRDIHAPEAWDVTTGDTSIVVAIVDTGVYPDHPDLAGQFWTHWVERTGIPGVDDDGNGYVDDDHGWDFIDLAPNADVRPGEDGHVPDNDPNDFAGHGTAVAGLVGARTNNGIGVAGTAWKVRLIPLRIGWSSAAHPSGEGDVSYMARAFRYATRMGAHVINCSFTTTNQPDFVAAVDAAIAAGVTIVAAAGNFAQTHYLAQREDAISVTGTGADDVVLGFATAGPSVDLAAAGYRLATTTLDRDTLGNRWPDYTGASGTSFSAPLVSGAVALMQADRRARGLPPLTPFEARLRLTDTADDIATLNAGSGGFGTGRLNLLRALTDPPGSRVAATRLRLMGPAVPLPAPNGPGLLAVVSTSGRLMILDAIAGETVHSVALPGVPLGGLSAASLGAGTGIGLFVATAGQLHGFDADLSPLPGWPIAVPTAASSRSREAVLADLNGDDVVEVLWSGARDGKIRVFAVDGRPFGAPIDLGNGSLDVTIAVSDLDGVPGLEIVGVSAAVMTVRRADGSRHPNWTDRSGVETAAPPLIARLGRNALPSVVYGYQSLYAMTNGQTEWSFPGPQTPNAGSPSQPPIVADLDGDGGAEVIQIRSHPMPIAVIDSAGAIFAGWQSPILTQNFDGPPIAGPVGPAGRMGILLADPLLGLRGYDRKGGDLRSYPKPGVGGLKPMIGDIDGDGRTEVVAGSYTSDDLMLYDSGPGSWPARPGSWLTARGNHARTGSLVYAPPLTVPARLPPLAVSDLAVVGVDADAGTVELRWTTPASPGGDPMTRFEVRHAATPFGPSDFFHAEAIGDPPVPGASGSVVTLALTHLAESATHFFGVRTRGGPGNWSALSNVVSASVPVIPPDPVIDLRMASRTDSILSLQWTATGDDRSFGRPRTYRVRAAEAPLDSATFETAPFAWELPAQVDGGGAESAELRGVPLGRHLWFAMIAVDSAGNSSTLSNLLEVTTTPVPPSRVGDLRGFGERASAARLRWTAVGEDGSVGRPATYLIRASEAPIDETSFDLAPLRWDVLSRVDAGGSESTVIEGLLERHYWIAIKALDRAGNRSALSNTFQLTLNAPPGRVVDFRATSVSDTSVGVTWTAVGADGATGRPASYQIRARDYSLSGQWIDAENFDDAPHSWDMRATVAAGGQQFADLGLQDDHLYSIAIAAVDSNGNRGALSNRLDVRVPSVPPHPLRGLRIVARDDTTITLHWTASGEDGLTGRPALNRFRVSEQRLTEDNFAAAPFRWDLVPTVDAGGLETAVFHGLSPNVRYFVAGAAIDVVGNRSVLTPNLEFTMFQTPPAPIEGLGIGDLADTSVTLVWTATGEDGRVGRPRAYLVRASEDSITAATFDACSLRWESAAQVDAGRPQSARIEGLEHGRSYWFTVVAADRNGNRSPVAQGVRLTPGPVPPAAAAGLRVAAESDEGVTIEWIASGEDAGRGRPARYSVHAADHPLDDVSFEGAPLQWEFPPTVDGGAIERATLPGFLPDRRHWVAIVAHDRFGNRAPLSEALEVTMRRYLPVRVADLGVASQRESSVVLRWTASGEDGAVGRPRLYTVRASRTPLDSASFDQAAYRFEAEATVDAGGQEIMTLGGLPPHHRYWVAVVAVDRLDNRSPISNVHDFWLGRLASRDDTAFEVESRPSRAPVRFLWRTRPGAPAGRSIRIYDLFGRLQSVVPLGDEEGGLAIWDGRDRGGGPAPAGVYFARLVVGGGISQTRVVLIR